MNNFKEITNNFKGSFQGYHNDDFIMLEVRENLIVLEAIVKDRNIITIIKENNHLCNLIMEMFEENIFDIDYIFLNNFLKGARFRNHFNFSKFIKRYDIIK